MGRSIRFLLASLILCAATARASVTESTDKIHIGKMVVVSDNLSEADQDRLVSRFESSEYFLYEIRPRIERITQGMGYLKAVAEEPEISFLKDGTASETVRVHEGSLYRLADIHIQLLGATHFAPHRLRALFPLKQGEPYDSAPIGIGLQKLQTLLVSCGYSRVTIAPTLMVDTSSLVVNLTIEVEEGSCLPSAECR